MVWCLVVKHLDLCMSPKPAGMKISCCGTAICSLLHAIQHVSGIGITCLIADKNGCLESTCDADPHAVNGTCKDVFAPDTGFTCDCAEGYTWNGAACEGGNMLRKTC